MSEEQATSAKKARHRKEKRGITGDAAEKGIRMLMEEDTKHIATNACVLVCIVAARTAPKTLEKLILTAKATLTGKERKHVTLLEAVCMAAHQGNQCMQSQDVGDATKDEEE